MGVLAGLFSLAALSLFLSHALRRSASLMPLVSVAIAMVFFSLCGIFGVLYAGGYVWYTACALALLVAVLREKGGFFKLFTPGLVFFLVASLVFIGLFFVTQPMLTHWDEFTFWGTAAKVTSRANELYTTARSSLIARSYPPGLIVLNYMMQFFGGYTEPGLMASFMVLYLACMAAGAAVFDKNRTAATLLLAALFFLPLFFAVNAPSGQMQWTYLVCMADLPMTLLFGGALCLYFAGGTKDAKLLLPFATVLCALAFVKDMGLALAVIALFVVLCDLVFCERERFSFFRLRSGKGLICFAALCLILVAGAYAVWAWHFAGATKLDRLDFGSQGVSLNPLQLVVTGVQMLFGFGRTEQFSAVLSGMLRALVTEPISLLGPGVLVLCIILAVSGASIALAAKGRQRRRALVFCLAMLLCFVAFYIFNIFTYALVFKHQEARMLKDYHRYIAPFWTAWLMAALVMLARTAADKKATFYRLRLGRGAAGAAAACVVAATLLLGNWQGNVARISPSFYTGRLNVKAVAGEAAAQGMKAEDTVYIISQGDDGSRFYLFGYELPAVRSLLYNGFLLNLAGELELDEAGMPIRHGNATATFVPYGTNPLPAYGTEANRKDLEAFLKEEGCTHILVDVVDEYILDEFAPMFSDELAGWSAEDPYGKGHRYYRVVWGKDGRATFVPALNAEGGAAA